MERLRGLPKAERLDFVKGSRPRADPNARATDAELRDEGEGRQREPVGATPFLIAAQSNDVAIMRELVAHGADPNWRPISARRR
jgi:hypothetical protein